MSGKTGTVCLFVRALPSGLSRRDLKTFVTGRLKDAGIRGSLLLNVCSNCSILKITDRDTGREEFHGLVEIQPARIAVQAIEALNGALLGGQRVEVRRYRHRSPWGEHRARRGESEGAAIRPLLERRRPNLKIELVEQTPALSERHGQPVG
jgi:hypothetical protein